MGKMKFVDHRQPSKAAKTPKVMRNGIQVEANPEPEIATDEVVQLRTETAQQRGNIEELERKLRVQMAETSALKQSLQDARDEATHLRHQMQQPELEGTVPNRIEIVTVDDIGRNDDIATLTVLADVDGTVGDTHVVIPVLQLKAIIKQKKQETNEQRTNGTAGVSGVRRGNEEDDLQDGAAVEP